MVHDFACVWCGARCHAMASSITGPTTKGIGYRFDELHVSHALPLCDSFRALDVFSFILGPSEPAT